MPNPCHFQDYDRSTLLLSHTHLVGWSAAVAEGKKLLTALHDRGNSSLVHSSNSTARLVANEVFGVALGNTVRKMACWCSCLPSQVKMSCFVAWPTPSLCQGYPDPTDQPSALESGGCEISSSASLGITDSLKLTCWICGKHPSTLSGKELGLAKLVRPDSRAGR